MKAKVKPSRPKTSLDKPPKRQFTLDWYKEFGWKKNPFQPQVMEPVHYFMTGHEAERQKLNYFIIQHQSFGTISAEKGCGATTLALWLRDELIQYKDRTPTIYIPLTGLGSVDFLHAIISATLSPHENILIHTYFRLGAFELQKKIGKGLRWNWLSRESFYASIAFRRYTSLDAIRGFLAEKLKDRSLVIILDHVEHMHKQHAQILQSFLYTHLPIQVIAVGTKEALSKAPLKIIQKKDALHIRLQKLSSQEMFELIGKRILYAGGQSPEPINHGIVKKIYDKFEKNPRSILSACQDYCVREGLLRLSKQHEDTPEKKEAKPVQGLPPQKGQHPEIHPPIEPYRPDVPTHPFTGEKVSSASIEEPEAASQPSFEIPADILKQIESEEIESRRQAKLDLQKKKKNKEYAIRVHTSEPSDEEVAIVETLVEEPKEEEIVKTTKARRMKSK